MARLFPRRKKKSWKDYVAHEPFFMPKIENGKPSFLLDIFISLSCTLLPHPEASCFSLQGLADSSVNLPKMQLTLEFGGGLELLCDSVKIHHVNVEPQDGEQKLSMKQLLSWVRSNLIKERPEMFMKGDSVRPGVLVLVNDCDWELSGQLDTTLDEKDVVVFISTLHGG